jgi:acetyl-CoA carboxylase biotin carboxyl carrier protein
MTMAYRFEPVGAADRDQRPTDEARETLREMCRNLIGLLRDAQTPARRVVMSVGPVSLEVEWAVANPAVPGAAVPAPGVGGAVATLAAAGLNGGHPVNGGAILAAAVNGGEPADPALTVKAPLVGTFYRAPEPGAMPFVTVGDAVEAGQQVGIVEAMKLMNPIETDRSGRVVQILVGDAEAVEYDQPLIVLAPLDEEA